jgi:hypothetical protein
MQERTKQQVNAVVVVVIPSFHPLEGKRNE